ncbi:MAG: ROK family protein [Candidatus Altiarchaeales archaeon]|nr:ROK family protein [Candidatus Altiarchaeales archaeon]MBD3415505.1 ROK family protein [Candidatus Altiarchaeales archaeon]
MARSVGVDVGGGTTISALVEDGTIIEQSRSETGKNPVEVVDVIVEEVDDVLGKAGIGQKDIEGVGVGVPAFRNPRTGHYRFPNIPSAEDVDLETLTSKKLKAPYVIGNDADYTAYGAVNHLQEFGILKDGIGSESMVELVLVTLGTGIGGGVILKCMGKHMIQSSTGGLTELGHIKVSSEPEYLCGCGAVGCVEATSSCTGIVKKVLRSLDSSPEEVRNAFPRGFTAEDVDRLSGMDNTLAEQVMESAGRHLGLASANIINTYNPSVLAYTGGGASSSPDSIFFTNILSTLEANTLPEAWEAVKVVKNPDAKRYGVLGAAEAALKPF